MPDFLIADPSGKQFKLSAPDGVSQEDATRELARTMTHQDLDPVAEEVGRRVRQTGQNLLQRFGAPVIAAKDLTEQAMSGTLDVTDPETAGKGLSVAAGIGTGRIPAAARGTMQKFGSNLEEDSIVPGLEKFERPRPSFDGESELVRAVERFRLGVGTIGDEKLLRAAGLRDQGDIGGVPRMTGAGVQGLSDIKTPANANLTDAERTAAEYVNNFGNEEEAAKALARHLTSGDPVYPPSYQPALDLLKSGWKAPRAMQSQSDPLSLGPLSQHDPLLSQ